MHPVTKVIAVLLTMAIVAMMVFAGVIPARAQLSEVWVDDSWAGSSLGASVDEHTFGTDAFATIQDGIDAVASPGTVHVAAGTYYENITLKDGVEALGAGADVTIINGSGSGSVVTTNNVGSGTKLDGFTIINGSADWGGDGMYNGDNSSATVTNCTFSGNSAYYGGGMYNYYSSATVTNCTFSGNSAEYGGGMHNYYQSSPAVTNCILWDNSEEIYDADASTPVVTYCDVQGGRSRQH